jgi:integrase
MQKPERPHPDFPLGAWPNGQWGKKIKGKPYYFGSWQDDPKGEAAIREYNDRLPGILGGTDHLRHLTAGKGQMSVGQLSAAFLAQKRLDVTASTLSLQTLGDYLDELSWFVSWIKPDTGVAALKPEHFTGYATHLVEARHLKSRAKKRTIAYVKAMFHWGAGNGHCPLPNFGTGFKAPSTTKQAIRKEKARSGEADYSDRIVTGEEVDKLLEASQPNLRAMVLLGINCGFGPADVGRIKWKHIRGNFHYFPRPKTGEPRRAYLWKRTREALERVKELKHTKAAIAKDGDEALIFITKKRQAYYRETPIYETVGGEKKLAGVSIANAVSITFGRTVKKLKLKGISFYRLRHTFKTLGKKAKDRDALNLCMGHANNTVEAGYDHEDISHKRTKRVALVVKGKLWPQPKQAGGSTAPTMRLADDGGEHAEAA